MYLVETHCLLPNKHFGGWPGWFTTDTLHLLVDTVKAAWQCKQVVAALFLDINGAFPNAVTEQLLYNLQVCHILEVYVTFIKNMLTGRCNRLKFNDYVSDWFELNNGIVQGDLLLMILYLFYNADMLDITHGRHELCLGYVDDMALIASADTFENAHRMLGNMMSWPGSGLQWAAEHNSKFEMSKSILIDFSRPKGVGHLDMSLQGSFIKLSTSHKFLGVQLDQELHWK